VGRIQDARFRYWESRSKNREARSSPAWIKYKISTDKVLQIEPKQDLKKRTGKPPDYAETFMLTCTPQPPQANVRML
jgi:hypothetical protein